MCSREWLLVLGWGEIASNIPLSAMSLLGSPTVEKNLMAPPSFFKCDKGNILVPNLVRTLRNIIPAVRVNEKSHESCQLLLLLHGIKLSLH